MSTYRPRIILLLVAVACGVIIGALGQKYYVIGRVLNLIGVQHRPLRQAAQRPRTNSSETSDAIPPALQGKLALFILAGQSNMSGYGKIPPEQIIDPNVFVFGNNYRWRIAREPIDDSNGQVDRVSFDQMAGVGPGHAFAHSLRKLTPHLIVGLIPCAKGSSTIAEWQRHLSDNTLYGSCLKRFRAASVMGRLAGMLFFQGEQDAVDPQQATDKTLFASTYATKFSQFVEDLRRDTVSPNLPVVYAQIGPHTAPKAFVNWKLVQQQQAMIDLPYTSMITTNDLELQDMVHFNTASYQIIGKRYAKAMARLMLQASDD